MTEEKRLSAWKVWKSLLGKCNIGSAAMGAPFRARWSPGDLADDLSVTSDVLWGLSRSLTEKSVPVFRQKVREFVASRTDDEYVVRQSELEVAGLLASRVSPIAFEPAVPATATPNLKPPSSDYSVYLPCGEVFVEATTIDLSPGMSEAQWVKRLLGKLNEKRRQAFRDRVYVVALKLIGSAEAHASVCEFVTTRAWPNPKFRRYGGILVLAEGPDLGLFRGAWLPNLNSVAPPEPSLNDLLGGRRCFHLVRVRDFESRRDDVERFRRMVSNSWSRRSGLRVAVRLVDGPLDGIEILMKPTEVGDGWITFVWESPMTVTHRASGERLEIPPHGPVLIRYKREEDTRYRCTGFQFWIDEHRPTNPKTAYLPKLHLTS